MGVRVRSGQAPVRRITRRRSAGACSVVVLALVFASIPGAALADDLAVEGDHLADRADLVFGPEGRTCDDLGVGLPGQIVITYAGDDVDHFLPGDLLSVQLPDPMPQGITLVTDPDPWARRIPAAWGVGSTYAIDFWTTVPAGTPNGSYEVENIYVNASGSTWRSFGPTSLKVIVDCNDPPILNVPSEPVVIEADGTTDAWGTAGAMVDLTELVTYSDPEGANLQVSCWPLLKDFYPLGSTTVTCTVSDGAEDVTKSFTVRVEDGTGPTLTLPPLTVVEGDSLGGAASVSWIATATDLVDASPTVSCIPASGSFFALGGTSVACTATDDAGNASTGSFAVRVEDTTAPTLTLPTDITVTASGGPQAVVAWSASATDVVWGAVGVTCSPASGSTLPVGTTTVTCTATDGSGNTASGGFAVEVRYDNSGFLSPIDPQPSVNVMKAGKTVPLKFILGGDMGMDVLASGSPSSTKVVCEAGADLDPVEETVAAGNTGLSYDPATGQYAYLWKTHKAWGGTCRRLDVSLADGTVLSANFRFTG